MNKPKVLLINDIHVSKENIVEFKKNWNEAIDICKEKGIKDLVIGGDLWQSRSSQTLSTLLAVKEALLIATNNNIAVTIAEGNHDKVDQEAYQGYGHIFSEVDAVYVVDDYSVLVLDDNVHLYIMSYFPENGSFQERLKEIVELEIDSNATNILYIHEGISGALSTPSDKELPTHIFKSFDKVLVGHYHDRCVIPKTNIEYIGASRQHNFGEDEEKGYTILYSTGMYEFIKNNVNIRYKTLDVTIKQINERLIDNIKALRENDRYRVRLRIKCKSKEVSSVNKQELVEAGANKIEFITEDTISTSITNQTLDKKFDKSGIKEEYCDFCASKGVDDVEMGLSYLDKIN